MQKRRYTEEHITFCLKPTFVPGKSTEIFLINGIKILMDVCDRTAPTTTTEV